MHKMYRVTTDKGKYAIKALNPDIMQRPAAMQNTVNSERIAHALEKHIPLIAAKEIDGQHMISMNDKYFIVFDWLDGRSIFVPDIQESHCEQIGNVLGKIHTANICINGIEKEQAAREVFPWEFLYEEAKRQKAAWLATYEECLLQIKEWDKQVVKNMTEVLQYQIISHRDLDPKNVMWKDDKPFIIDWEAAGYVNPFQELVEVLNYWTVDKAGEYQREKVNALLQAYQQNMDMGNANWEAVLCCSFDGMLGWLAYSVRRALGLEGSAEKDKKEGEEQLLGTIRELRQYEARMEQLKEVLYHRV